MNPKNKQLLIALVIGAVALLGNKLYIDSVVDDLTPKKSRKVVRVKSALRPGMTIKKGDMESAHVPNKYLPKAFIDFSERDEYVGLTVTAPVQSGDYLLKGYFDEAASIGEKLSLTLDGDNTRAVALPVDGTMSLSQSILAGDKIDILFTFNVPLTGQKMSVLFLQNVPVIATGSYSAADSEVGKRGGRAKKYSSLTLKLSAEDAFRLDYARQAGKISLMLRNEQDTGVVDLPPISSVADLLSAADRNRMELIAKARGAQMPNEDKIKQQMKEVLELQKRQVSRLKAQAK